MILIDATYINSGGGLVLLKELLVHLRGRGDFALLRDIRVSDLDTCGYLTCRRGSRLAEIFIAVTKLA